MPDTTNLPFYISVECYGGQALGRGFEIVITDINLWSDHYRAYLCLNEPHNGLLR